MYKNPGYNVSSGQRSLWSISIFQVIFSTGHWIYFTSASVNLKVKKKTIRRISQPDKRKTEYNSLNFRVLGHSILPLCEKFDKKFAVAIFFHSSSDYPYLCTCLLCVRISRMPWFAFIRTK